MKKITITILLALFVLGQLFSQSPQAFKYQAVARDNSGNTINNQLVSFRISILQGSASGSSVYTETHQITTNAFGLANFEIGNGTTISGSFIAIDWSTGLYFLKLEMDVSGGSAYQTMGTSQLLSVPYALYSENTFNTDDADADPTNEYNSGFQLNGNSLEVTDAGGTLSVDLGTFAGDSDWTLSGDDMYSNAAGNVAIGTTTNSTYAKLTVGGHISFDGTGRSVFIGTGAGLNDDLVLNDNVFIGDIAGASNTSGNQNIAIGRGSLNNNVSGYENTAAGSASMWQNIDGNYNTALGRFALYSNTSGSDNVALGYRASYANELGTNNTAIGSTALQLIEGSNNTAIGFEAGKSVIGTTMNGGVFLGYQAGKNEITSNKLYIENSSSASPLIYGEFDNDIVGINGRLGVGTQSPSAMLEVAGHISVSNTGSSVFIGKNAGSNDDLSFNYNTFVGENAGLNNTTGSGNTAMGAMTLFNNTDKSNLVAIGDSALFNNGLSATLDYQARNNTAIGSKAMLSNKSGYDNTGVGYNALNANISGAGNTAIGSAAFSKASGSANTAIGSYALESATYSEFNTAVGSQSLLYNTIGLNNTALGTGALYYNVTGSNNTAIGLSAGNGIPGNSINGCIFIGYQAGYNVSTNNKLYIENSDSDLPLIYGEFDNDIVAINGKLGIGTLNPSADLEVKNLLGDCLLKIIRSSPTYSSSIQLGDQTVIDYSITLASGNHNLVIYRGPGNSSGNLGLMHTGGNVGVGTNSPDIKFHVVGGSDASLSGGGYLLAGSTTGENVVIDENEIMARLNGAANTLHLQRDGGSLSVHYGLASTSQFLVNSSGWTGIGTNSPNSKLHVNTATGETAFRVQISGGTKFLVNPNGAVVVGYNNSSPTFALQLQNSSIDLLGRGLAYSWTIYSDDRLKSNQKQLAYGLKEVMQLQPKSYDHHSSEVNEEGIVAFAGSQKEATIGFIAQEVQEIIPEAVYEPEDDSKNLWGMDYEKLIPVLTKAIQEQQGMIEQQQKMIELLQSEVADLKNQ